MVLTPKLDEYRSKARDPSACRTNSRSLHQSALMDIAQKWEDMAVYEEKMRHRNDAD